MPGNTWTTSAQEKFLEGFKGKFLKEQEAGTLTTWFPTLYEEYLTQWPEADPDELVEVTVKGKTVMQTRLAVRKSVSKSYPSHDDSLPRIRNSTIGFTTIARRRRQGGS